MVRKFISIYKQVTRITKIKIVYLIPKSATQTKYNKKEKENKKWIWRYLPSMVCLGTKFDKWQTEDRSGSCYSMDNVRQEKRFLDISTWNCLNFTRSIAESIIGPRLSFKPNTVGRCRTIDCCRSRGFFFPWEKVNREARTRFHNVNSGLVCLKPTRESRYPSYSDRQYLFILIHPWYNITPR